MVPCAQFAFANGGESMALGKVEVRHGRMTQVITGIGKPRSKPARHDKHDGPVISLRGQPAFQLQNITADIGRTRQFAKVLFDEIGVDGDAFACAVGRGK